jgi:CRP-like cAMP-binding protein
VPAADQLRNVPFLSTLSDRQRNRLAAKFRERRFKPGTAVVQEATMSGVGFFIVTSGEASVTIGGEEVGRLRAGDHFGELALIAERERTATITAQSELECLELAAWDFREFVQADGEVAWELLRYAVNLLLDAQPRERQSIPQG